MWCKAIELESGMPMWDVEAEAWCTVVAVTPRPDGVDVLTDKGATRVFGPDDVVDID